MKTQKALTERQAKNCEEAREPVCHCRCHGQAHGAKRGGGNAPMEFYYNLPEDDPHYTPSPEKRKQQREEREKARKAERQARIDAAWNASQELLSAMYKARREENYDLANELSQQFLKAHAVYEAVRKSKGTLDMSQVTCEE